VTSQATRTQQATESSATTVTGEGEATANVDIKISKLRSVVAYLRKEKKIVDLQLDLSKRENVRLKSQVDHLSQSLEETRAILPKVIMLFCAFFKYVTEANFTNRNVNVPLKRLHPKLSMPS
jgi:hypothetical protein